MLSYLKLPLSLEHYLIMVPIEICIEYVFGDNYRLQAKFLSLYNKNHSTKKKTLIVDPSN